MKKIQVPKKNSSDNKKTKSTYFRIPDDMEQVLETDAAINKTSINTLLTQILTHHIEYDGKVASAGLVSFPRPLLVTLMDGYSEKQVIAMSDSISKDFTTDMMTTLHNEYTPQSFLSVTAAWARASHIPFRHEIKGELNTCVMRHNLSKNWSLYLGHLYKNVLEGLTQKKVSIMTTANTVRIMF